MRSIAPVLLSLLLVACGGGGDSGGGGGGGGGGGSNYSISVAPTSVSINGLAGASPVSQAVTVTFRGDGVVIGTLPGQTLPPWLSVSGPSASTSPASVDIIAQPNVAPGTYSATLRFVTGKADGSNVVYVDVPISYTVVQGQFVFGEPFGQANGSTVAVSLNGGPARTLVPGIPTGLGAIASGSSYTVSVPTQPTGQTCSFPDGNTTSTGTIGPTNQVQLRVTCNASLIPWTYVGGPKTLNEVPVYGIRGTPAAGNTPGGRQPGAYARDAAGNLWLFGGVDANGHLNDLWRYDVASGMWTWVSGPTTRNVSGTFGTLLTPSASNLPGARASSVAWIDGNGNFWLFGGYGYASIPGALGFLNDLWMYNVAGDTWTWMGGGNTIDLGTLGTYGTTPSTSNIPGGRMNATVVKDANGDVWYFGGNGAGATNSVGLMNDLWKFTPSTRVWNWMSGADQPIQTRVQGTIGVPSAANYPNARDNLAAWTDTSGNFWMFGGNAGVGFENDLWRYDPGTDMWTWIGGTDRTNPSVAQPRGTYNPPGTAGNYPTSRTLASSWTDASGNFWLFGGYGQSADSGTGGINDLWKYSPSTNAWYWLSGSNAVSSPAIYGTQGMAANTNVPSGRSRGVAWTDTMGRMWLWGGGSLFPANSNTTDVWRVTPQ